METALLSGNSFFPWVPSPFLHFFVGLFGFVNVSGRVSSSDAFDLVLYYELLTMWWFPCFIVLSYRLDD